MTHVTATATVRHNPKTNYIVITCPIGHLIEARKCDHTFGGSAFEAEIGAWQAGRPNRFNRQAAKCNGAGHKVAT